MAAVCGIVYARCVAAAAVTASCVDSAATELRVRRNDDEALPSPHDNAVNVQTIRSNPVPRNAGVSTWIVTCHSRTLREKSLFSIRRMIAATGRVNPTGSDVP